MSNVERRKSNDGEESVEEVAGRWSLVVGRWSLVVGRWSLGEVAGWWLSVAGKNLGECVVLVVGRLVVGRWSFGRWEKLLVGGCRLLEETRGVFVFFVRHSTFDVRRLTFALGMDAASFCEATSKRHSRQPGARPRRATPRKAIVDSPATR